MRVVIFTYSSCRCMTYKQIWFFILTIFIEGADLTFNSILPLIYLSSIVKSRSNPILEPTGTKQQEQQG